MKTFLTKVKALLHQNYQISASETDLNSINELILSGNQSDLFHIEMDLCQSQKRHCIQQVHHALDSYHHSGMDTEEIKTIVENVLTHKAPTPDITETVRLLIAK